MNLNPKKISAHASLNDLLQMSLNHNNNSNNSNNNNMATPSSSSATVEVTKPSSSSAAASAVPFHGPIKTLQPQTEPRIKDNLDHDSKQQQQQQQHYHRKLHYHSNAESSNKDLPPQVIVTIQTAPIASGVHDFNQDLIQTSTSSEFESSPQRHSHHRRVHSDYSDYNRFPTTTLLDYDYDSITNIHRNTKSSSSMIHTDPKNNPFRSPLTPQSDTLPSETQTLTSSRTFPIAASSGSPLRSSLPLSSPLSFQDSDFDSSQVPSRRPKSSSQIPIPTTSTTAPTPTPSTTNTTSPIPLPSFSVRPTTSLIARGNNLMRSKSMTAASTSTTTTTPVMITYDNVASDHHNKAQQEYEYKQEYGHSKSLRLDTASLAEIAAQLSYLKPVVHQDLHATTTGNSTTCSNTSAAAASAAAQANNTIPSNPIRQDSHDSDHNVHLVTLGDDPGDCTTGKKRHRRLGGSAPVTSIVNANSITTTSTTATPTTTTNNPVRTNNHSASVIHSVSTVSEKDELIHRRSFSAGWSNVWGNIAGASGGSSARPNSGGGASSSHSRKSTPTATASTLLVTDTHTSLASLDLDLTPIIVEKEIKIRSSEQDPTPHQVSIPSASETLFQAKLCAMMENYRNVDQNFDFSCLINMSQDQIQSLMKKGVRSTTTNIHVQKSSYDMGGLRRSLDSGTDGNNYASQGPIIDLLAESQSTSRRGSMDSLPNANYQGTISSAATFQTNVPLNMHNKDLFNYNQQQIMAQHEPILTSVLEAGDLVLEGFYHEGLTTTQKKSKAYDTSKEKSTQDRMEVAIFKSDTRRQICVVYQDSTENQANPVKKREQKDGVQRLFRKDGDNRFSEEQPFSVYPPFRKAYMSNLDVERQVFAKLDELVEQNPFYDVIMTGHSMGAVLSVLSSMRYADLKPAIMVSCFAFGCPKVGSLDFRFYVHSLPNLKVVRFEYGYDPFTACPDHPSWVHLGHTILITKKEISKSGSSESLPHLQASEMSHVLHDPPVKAYKFGNVRPESSGVATRVGALGKILNRHRERNMDHELSSYVHVLEAMQGIGSQWPTVFVGEDGSGVQGLNDEKRHVC